jgi:hypothetical protein
MPRAVRYAVNMSKSGRARAIYASSVAFAFATAALTWSCGSDDTRTSPVDAGVDAGVDGSQDAAVRSDARVTPDASSCCGADGGDEYRCELPKGPTVACDGGACLASSPSGVAGDVVGVATVGAQTFFTVSGEESDSIYTSNGGQIVRFASVGTAGRILAGQDHVFWLDGESLMTAPASCTPPCQQTVGFTGAPGPIRAIAPWGNYDVMFMTAGASSTIGVASLFNDGSLKPLNGGLVADGVVAIGGDYRTLYAVTQTDLLSYEPGQKAPVAMAPLPADVAGGVALMAVSCSAVAVIGTVNGTTSITTYDPIAGTWVLASALPASAASASDVVMDSAAAYVATPSGVLRVDRSTGVSMLVSATDGGGAPRYITQDDAHVYFGQGAEIQVLSK